MAPEPPRGKSSVTPGRYQSASMYAMTAFIVPGQSNPRQTSGRPARKQSPQQGDGLWTCSTQWNLPNNVQRTR